MFCVLLPLKWRVIDSYELSFAFLSYFHFTGIVYVWVTTLVVDLAASCNYMMFKNDGLCNLQRIWCVSLSLITERILFIFSVWHCWYMATHTGRSPGLYKLLKIISSDWQTNANWKMAFICILLLPSFCYFFLFLVKLIIYWLFSALWEFSFCISRQSAL